MKKFISFVISLLSIILFLEFCEKEQKVDLLPTPPSELKEQLKIEEQQERKQYITEEAKRQIPIKGDRSGEEKMQALKFFLNTLKEERNIIVEDEAIELLNPLYQKYEIDDLNNSFYTYIETLLVIDPEKNKLKKEDIIKYKKLSLATIDRPRPIGLLTIVSEPIPELARIVGLKDLKDKFEEEIKMTESPHTEQLAEGMYEVLVYFNNRIRGDTNVEIKSYKEDKKGNTLKYIFSSDK